MDKDGYIIIVGRSKDMVIRGGENIFPVQIEDFLYTLSQNRACAGLSYQYKCLSYKCRYLNTLGPGRKLSYAY